MAALTVSKYRTIAGLYASAQVQIAGVTDYYYDAAYEIVIVNEFDPEIDLLQPFYNAYLSSQTVFLQAPPAIVAAVTTLQRHIIDKARTDPGIDADGTADRFTNINQWIDAGATNGYVTDGATGRNGDSDNSFKVPQEFADLSSQGGFDIDADNIL